MSEYDNACVAATLQKKHSSMGVFHVFQFVQMVPNRATHHICIK